jgi:CBS domain-containing protein
MSVGTCCQRDAVKVAPNLTVREVAKQMELQDAGCVVVVDADDRPVGIVTDRDVALRVLRRGADPDATRVDEIMESPVETVRERTALTTAMRRMRADAVRRLPVVDGDGRVVGLFHWSTAVGLVSEELRQAAAVAAAQSRA